MATAVKQWIKRFDQASLPILSATAHQFSRQRSQPGACISKLWDSLSYDPGMCLNLLRVAGRSKYTQVTTMTHAILLMGLPNALEQARNLPRIEDLKDPTRKQLLLRHYHHAFHAYQQSEHWLSLRSNDHHEQIATASLNAQFIDYLLCCVDAESFQNLLKTQRQGIDRIEAEKKILGVLRRELAHELASHWQLPELMIESQSHGKHPQTNSRHVYLAQRLAEAAALGWYHQEMDKTLEEISEFLHQPLAQVTNTTHRVAVTANRLCHRPYHASPGVASRLNEHEAIKLVNPPIPLPAKKTRKEILKDCAEKLDHSSNLDYRKILNLSFKAIRDGIGLERVVFAMLEEDRRHLTVKYALDTKDRTSLQGLQLPLHKNTLFEQLLRQPGALWMNDSSRQRYLSFLPKGFQQQFKSDAFFAMSVFLHEKPIAMFYADGCKSGNLTENQFKCFKKICTHATQALARVSDTQDRAKVANG